MSSYIAVFGHNQEELDWMKENYQAASNRFKEIHPAFEFDIKHGIHEHRFKDDPDLKGQYHWSIACHWDSDAHLKQTEKDINLILKELKSPEGLEIHLSPNT